VVIVVRNASLSSTMSQYLIDQIKETPNIQIWANASVSEVSWRNAPRGDSFFCSDSNKIERVPASSMFIFIGAYRERIGWRAWWSGDERGFILTDPIYPGRPAAQGVDAGSGILFF